MYSPRIREALIPRVYRAAKESGIPMTAWVNRAIAKALKIQETPEERDAVRRPEGQPTERKETP